MRLEPERCSYCLRELSPTEMTVDHVIAGAWYPSGTSSAVERWTVPACNKCNNCFSSIERYVHTRIAACIDPGRPAAAGMWENALRSVTPSKARNDKDRRHRAHQRQVLWNEMITVEVPPKGTLPFSVGNLAQGSRTALRIDAKKLDDLIKKWARGIHRVVWKVPCPLQAQIEIFHVSDLAAEIAFKGADAHWKILDGGEGIKVSYLAANEGVKRVTVYRFDIWGRFRCFAYVEEIATDPLELLSLVAASRLLSLHDSGR